MTPKNNSEASGSSVKHHVCFVVFAVASVVALWAPLRTLIELSLRDDRYSHVPIVGLIGVILFYLERKKIFDRPRFSFLASLPLFVAGIWAYWMYRRASVTFGHSDGHFAVSALIATWMAGFALCYGIRCFKAASFPLLFILLMMPVPSLALDKIVVLLQRGSAAVAYALFRAFGIPVFWSGSTFALPGVDIEVAKECSGIRSTTSLFVTAVLASHLILRSGWRKIFLSVLTIPVAIFKNAVRIVTLSSLGVYVDRGFLFGKLHHYGGVPFALIALAILLPTLLMLQRSESNSKQQLSGATGPPR